MSNTQGWGLTARLIGKHFGKLGDSIAEAIASFDPETATEADRERLQSVLTQTATKLAAARLAFKKESADVDSLKALIATDTDVAAKLMKQLEDGAIDEATVNLLCDELEANKARLPIEEAERTDAESFMKEIEQIVEAMTQQLREFDKHAQEAKRALSRANAQLDLQSVRTQRQNELNSLKGIGGHSNALSALTKRAEKVQAQADGMKIVADINQAPIDQAKKLDDIRKSVNTPPAESAAERLKRLTASK